MRHSHQYRSISRELVLLSLCQINDNPKLERRAAKQTEKIERKEALEREREKILNERLEKLLSLNKIKQNDSKEIRKEELNILISTAIGTLRAEIQDNLEAAAKEISDGSDRISNKEERAIEAEKAQIMLEKTKGLAAKLREGEPDRKTLESLRRLTDKFKKIAKKRFDRTEKNENKNKQNNKKIAEEEIIAEKLMLDKMILILTLIEREKEEDTLKLLKKIKDQQNIYLPRELASALINAKTIVDYCLELSQRVEKARELSQIAINRLGYATELQEFVQISNQYEVREYALKLLEIIVERDKEIREQIEEILVGYSLDRLALVDRQILKIAVAEIVYIEDIPEKVAINEAVELAKRYSGEEISTEKDRAEETSGGYRFINGVLRRVSDRLKAEAKS